MSSFPPLLAPSLETNGLRSLPRAKVDNAAQAQKVGVEFEQMFLAQMLQPIFDAIPTDGMFGGGAGERMFRSFQIDEYAKAMTKSGGIGIANAVAHQIITLQEKNHG